uniref:Sugar phosphate exchanger 3 n=1 Tax=Schmidtea mediterranea TaxID=79327 RepID=A0A0H3YKG7_SCHMD|nr:slc37a-2 [Schmidtea mediterranea]
MKFRLFHFYKSVVFIVTFFAYGLLHANRKSFSNVKPTFTEEWTGTNNNTIVYPLKNWKRNNLFLGNDSAQVFLGVLDTVFMGFYAIGLYASGYIGDRYDPTLVLSAGMFLSSISIFIFGVLTEWIHFYNYYFYVVFYALNGLFQSTGWPATVTIMSNWFGHSRGFWLGLWSGCACVGNIIGDLLTASVLDFGYEYGFLVPCAALFTGSIVVVCSLIAKPENFGSKLYRYSRIQTVDIVSENNSVIVENFENKNEQYISFWKIILIPGVIPYSLAYACLKLVNYAFFFWLADYLSMNFNWTNAAADTISIWYDVGGIIGGIVIGIISDFMWSRSPVTVLSLILTIPALVVYRNAPGDVLTNSIYLTITGIVIGGPATLISSAISADLGSEPLLSGNAAALSTVTGIIDGTGSVGAAIGQVCVPLIQNRFQWQAVFIFFMIMISITIVCILPVLVKDIIKRVNLHRKKNAENPLSFPEIG